MKNNFILNLFLVTVIAGTLLFLVVAMGCNERYDDNNSPAGSSYSTEVKGDQRHQNDPTDPQHTGAVPDRTQTTGNMPTKHEGSVPPIDSVENKKGQKPHQTTGSGSTTH